ncbi:hypothetical protein [Sinorhizobium medicae]|uniref:hypothetical protein n=1 Tax=Sinorhizobium medicae TaxID=110321 RepID=UPI000FE0B398|nr:hypothetical protein [Sinorhizobium medicae]MBO1965337.1 hypothetical protein [Sinorhizobium medicae]MDW9943746.1 hypothetical protein [Sinorhizobium meliloti]RVG51654.1 hypothetical protein CN226_18015 [Sinorhizobium meliloti]WQO56806.1 hypothetical protein U8C36_35860 [Sinorhizobium medicae]
MLQCPAVQRQRTPANDQISSGPQLQIAKSLIDGCIMERSEGSVTRSALGNASFPLASPDGRDRNTTTLTGSKGYVRSYERDTPKDDWRAITIDLARA